MKFGTVAIVGRSNVGKTTFLNAALGEDLAVVSPVPQTTRENLLGVVHRKAAQIGFLDTPGIHRPRSELGRRMNDSAIEGARGADAILFMLDASVQLTPTRRPNAEHAFHPEDQLLLQTLAELKLPTVAVVNKVDLIGAKSKLLPLLEALGKVHDFSAIIPATVLEGADVERVLSALETVLSEGSKAYADDTLTDRPLRFFLAEYVREQVLLQCRKEVPHAVAVSIDKVEESPQRTAIYATLHVEKEGQRRILVGAGGAQIKAIGTLARQRIEARVGHPVYLKLFVRITPRWKHIPIKLAEFGYGSSQFTGEAALAKASTKPKKPRASTEPKKPRKNPA